MMKTMRRAVNHAMVAESEAMFKAFLTMTGDVSSVQAGVNAGRAVLAEAGVLVNAVVLSRPPPDIYREVV